MPARLAAALFAGWMVVLGVIFRAEPDWQAPVYLVAGVSVVLAVASGLRRHKPDRAAPWRLLAFTLVLSVLGTAALAAPRWLAPVRPAGNWLLLAVYPLMALVLLWFARLRTGGSRDRGGLLDALTITSGITLLAWTCLIGPYVRTMDVTVADQWIAIAYPAGDLLCLGMLIRLLTTYQRRQPAVILLGAGILAMIAADVGGSLVLPHLNLEPLAAAGRIPLYAAVGLAVLSPSMRDLTGLAPAPPTDFGRLRLALLAAASLIAPALLVGRFRPHGQLPDPRVIAGLSALTFLLVLARMAGIMASHRLAIARERGLREAAAALVSAANPDQVGDAVRTAVARLLPADAPHRVVLAMAIAQPEQPLSGPALAQAEQDRVTGTSARLVHTREVDWAVAVRLSQFSMVLRCPLVLQDRPTGDPLVGVLNVGGPTWALLGLQQSIEVLATQVALALERITLSEEVTRRNSETYFRTLVQNTSDVILIVDEQDHVRYASPSAGPARGSRARTPAPGRRGPWSARRPSGGGRPGG